MFTEATLAFLTELADHNDREWFAANKQRYEDDVREPARALIRALGERLPDVSTAFVASDKKVGGSLMRIHRDVRFSKDKSPYKTNIGVQLRHAAGKDVHAPGFYVHIEPGEAFVGCGLWRPPSPALRAIRDRIAAEPDAYAAIVGAPGFAEVFEPHGESLKRVPRGYAKDHPQAEALKRKSHIVVSTMPPTDALGPGFVDTVMDRIARSSDYVRFLCGALDQPF